MPSHLLSSSMQLFRERPGFYLAVASLPYVTLHAALWWALFQFMSAPSGDSANLRDIWLAMSPGDKFEFLILSFLTIAFPFAVAGFGLCNIASNQIEKRPIAFRKVALSMAGFLPSALLLSILVGASTLLGMCFLLVPGIIAFTAFSLVVPAASIEGLGPFAALRRGFSLTIRAFGRLLLCCFVYGLVVVFAFIVQGVMLSSLPHTLVARIVVMTVVAFALLTPLAILNICLTLIFYELRQVASSLPSHSPNPQTSVAS